MIISKTATGLVYLVFSLSDDLYFIRVLIIGNFLMNSFSPSSSIFISLLECFDIIRLYNTDY